MPHPDGAICEALPPAIDEIGHALAQAGGISGWCLICSFVSKVLVGYAMS